MRNEIVYCGSCHCNHSCGIKSDFCKKRFYDIDLPTKIAPLRLVFCAEYLRSCIQTEMISRDTTYLSDWDIKKIIKDIIKPFLPNIVSHKGSSYGNYGNIYFMANRKLFIHLQYTFLECLEMLINEPESKYTSILDSVVYEVNNYCSMKGRYLKYKSRVEKLQKLAKKIKNSNIDESGIICCEILSIMMMSESEIKKQEKLQLINQ